MSNMKPLKTMFKDKNLASYWGKIGGSKSSQSKTLSCRINALKNGKYTKDPVLKKLITPTATEKMLGITHNDKILTLKKHNSFYGAENLIEACEGAEETVAIAEGQLGRWKAEQKRIENELSRLYNEIEGDERNLFNKSKEFVKYYWQVKKDADKIGNKIFYGGRDLANLKNKFIERKFGKDPEVVTNILNQMNQTQNTQKISVGKIINALTEDENYD